MSTVTDRDTVIAVEELEDKEVGSLSHKARVKKELGPLLAKQGMPEKEYLCLLTKRPTEQWLRDNGAELIEGNPTISSKDRTVMYNFTGKFTTVAGRMGGNHFTTKRVGPAMFARYLEAIALDEAGKKGKVIAEVEDLDIGETTE